MFYTPFWVEGWTLHWEVLLWERGWARTPEERIGMLFWRMHRGARVVFSLAFHLGQMTPDECVEMLVGEVGHERDNAIAEVRRSFGGDYDPLYQAAYLLGGLQVHALYREMTENGRMTAREFHDAYASAELPADRRDARRPFGANPSVTISQPWRFDTPDHHLRIKTLKHLKEKSNDPSPTSARPSPPPRRPSNLPAALAALWYDGRGDWNAAHEAAQSDEGRDGAWVHAYLHRKEGDAFNAGYWYRRAGKPAATGTLDVEWVEPLSPRC